MGLLQSIGISNNPDTTYVAISRHYVQTVKFFKRPSILSRYPIRKISITKMDCLNTFTKNEDLIITTLRNAYEYFSGILNTGHNTTPDFIEPGVLIFGSPVFFEVPANFVDPNQMKELEYSDINKYMDTSEIPLYTSYTGNKHVPDLQIFDAVVARANTNNRKLMITKKKINLRNITGMYCLDGYGNLIKL